MRIRVLWALVLITGIGVGAWMWLAAAGPGGSQGKPSVSGPRASSVFTPAHRNLRDAVADFLGWRPTPVQPIAFTHRVHIANKIGCTDYCHTGATQGPEAGIPSVNVCMICHGMIAIDRPEIQKIAAYQERGEEIPWQRVYGFSRSAHVKFNHAPHIRAGVACTACHGDVAQQTVAARSVNLTMGYCLDCHRARQASTECVTCHF